VLWTFFWRYVLVLAALLHLAGCGTYRMTGLSDYSDSELAVLELPFGAMYSPIFVTHIDCRSRGVGWYKRFEMIPGWRVITLSGNSQMGVSPSPKSYVFEAQPGIVYTFESDKRGGANDWLLVIVNQETGEPIEYYWQRAQWSYWNGTTPNETLCEESSKLNMR
jgi:hypothetical protein